MGGSFDPPHRAHLLVTELAMRVFRLSYVIWAICERNPHKAGHSFSLESRVLMAREVSFGHRVLLGVSGDYAVETISDIRRNNPMYDLLWITGDDSWALLGSWRRWQDVRGAVPMAVFRRTMCMYGVRSVPHAHQGFCGMNVPLINKGSWSFVNNFPNNESSTRIRSQSLL